MNNSTGFSYQVSLVCSPVSSTASHTFSSLFSFFLCCAVALRVQTNFFLVYPDLTNPECFKPPVSEKFPWCLQLIFLPQNWCNIHYLYHFLDVLTHYLILTILYAFAFHPVCETLNFRYVIIIFCSSLSILHDFMHRGGYYTNLIAPHSWDMEKWY